MKTCPDLVKTHRKVHSGYVRSGDFVINTTTGAVVTVTDNGWHYYEDVLRLKQRGLEVWRLRP